jgi:hypothetical protein
MVLGGLVVQQLARTRAVPRWSSPVAGQLARGSRSKPRAKRRPVPMEYAARARGK